jgi:hypothetical protein
MKRLRRGLRLVAMAALILLLAACYEVKIADINRDPTRFSGREVSVRGRVVTSFGALGEGAYQLDDGSGRIWVLSEGFGVPGDGVKCSVKGTVQSGVTFGGRSFGNVLRETQKRRDD